MWPPSSKERAASRGPWTRSARRRGEKLVFIQDISQKPDQTFLRRNGQEAHVGAVAVRGTPFHIGHVRGKIATRLVVQEPLHARAKTGEAINNRFVQYVNGKQGYESDH